MSFTRAPSTEVDSSVSFQKRLNASHAAHNNNTWTLRFNSTSHIFQLFSN